MTEAYYPNETTGKRQWVMPYQYFRDDQVLILEKSQPELIPMDVFYRKFRHFPKTQPEPKNTWYLLNKLNRRLMDVHGLWESPYHDYSVLEDHCAGQTAFVICPGPSAESLDYRAFEGKFTLAVNSAGWKLNPLLWIMFESNYMNWFKRQKYPKGRNFIMTARCAARWRAWGHTSKTGQIFVPRFEEDQNMPGRVPAVTSMGAIVTAWWMGAKKIYLCGLDLGRPGGTPYVSGVPHSKEGATNTFDYQVHALRQFQLPPGSAEIYNASPVSADKGLPFHSCSYEEVEQAAREAPECHLSL